jgi:hypothetical protein
LFTARELVGIAISQERLEPAEPKDFVDSCSLFHPSLTGRMCREFDIGKGAQMRPQRQILKDEAHLALVSGHGVSSRLSHSSPVKPNLAGIRTLEAGYEPQQRCLSRPTRADDHHALARRYFQRHILDSAVTAIALGDPREPQKWRCHEASRVAIAIPRSVNGTSMTID